MRIIAISFGSNSLNQLRLKSGQVSLEVTIIAILMVVFATMSFNMFVAVWGFTILDSAAERCSQGGWAMPSRPAAFQAAQQAAAAHQTDGYFVGQPTIEDDDSDFQFVENPNKTKPPSGSPYVAVTMRSTIRLPVPIDIFGAQLLTGPYNYARTYVYPIMNGDFAPPVNYIRVVTAPSNKPFAPHKFQPPHVAAKAAFWNASDTVTPTPAQNVHPISDSIPSPPSAVTIPPEMTKANPPPAQIESPLEAPAPPAPAPPTTSGPY